MTNLKPLRGLFHTPRRALLLASAALLCVFLLPAVAAQADTSSTLTVVGTSDVSDSGLIPNLIGPEFQNAYPQFTFKYVGTASGAAITAAENGSDGASVLIVHAPSLENQFVAGAGNTNSQSWSYQGQPGHALWTNDFVLAGPSEPVGTADPAGVSTNASNNIVQAFDDIATAGYNGGSATPAATFVTRGNTSGTSVSEHAIWALVGAQATQPAGLTLCTLNAAEGGGETPVISSYVGTSGAACPAIPPATTTGVLPPAADVPDWYVTTGLSQGQNVVFANSCTTPVPPTGTTTYNTTVLSGPNTCYVFTDRGTYDYLKSGTDPSGAANSYYTIGLAILTRQESASAPGGVDELENYFHGYIINPSAVVLGGTTDEPVNLTAAEDFVNFITSPTVQAQLKNYLPANVTGDTVGGPPFVADASPAISESGIPSTVTAGAAVTVTGNVSNQEPSYPALVSDPVSVDDLLGGLSVPVGTGTTGAGGAYSINFTPPASGSYEVETGAITELVSSALSFSDVLSPGATAAIPISVQSGVDITAATPSTGGVTVSGHVAPAALDSNGKVTILARPSTSTGAFSEIGASSVGQGVSAYAISSALGAGTWQIEASYSDPGQFVGSTSAVSTVAVPSTTSSTPPAHTVAFKKVTAKNGKVTVTGTLKPGPATSGATVELLAVRTTTVKKTATKKKKKGVLARTASVALKEVAHTSVKTGKTTFTITEKPKRGYEYILELEYVQKGQTSSFSKLSSIAVH
jgi:tungstate transport system substrate-binding protein